MANTSEAIATANLQVVNVMATGDYVLVTLVTGNVGSNGFLVRNISMGNFFQQNVPALFSNLVISGNSTPANSTAFANVVQGQFWSDGNYLYYATANGVTKRLGTLATF